MQRKPAFARTLARKIALDYHLSYKTQVAVETTLKTMFMHGLSMTQAKNAIHHLFKNLFFTSNPPMLPAKK